MELLDEIRVALVSVPDEETGRKIGLELVELGLAACVNILPGVKSIYRWQDKVEEDAELLLVIKTRAKLLDRLTDKVMTLHPYDLPEVMALPVVGGSAAYLLWVWDQTQLRG